MSMLEAVTVEQFKEGLRGLAVKGFRYNQVFEYMFNTWVDPESLRERMAFSAQRYTRVLIDQQPGIFVLVANGWEPNQGSAIHDHGKSSCLLRVEEGHLRFTNYQLAPGNPTLVEQRGDSVNGRPGYLDDPNGGIHKVENFGSTRAISLHLYFPPLMECNLYNPVNGEVKNVKLGYDNI